MNNDKKQELKIALTEKGAGMLLQVICEHLDGQNLLYDEFTLLRTRWIENDTSQAQGVILASNYQVEKNQINKSLVQLVNDLNDGAIQVIQQALREEEKSPYKLLTLSKDENDRQRMEELLVQFPELNFKAALSSAPPEGTDTYHLLIFDNLSLGDISDIRHFFDADREHLELMEEWLAAQEESAKKKSAKKEKTQQAVRPGFIIHYGKHCYLVGEYSEYCAAANFPFTLYGLIRQMLDYWERS